MMGHFLVDNEDLGSVDVSRTEAVVACPKPGLFGLWHCEGRRLRSWWQRIVLNVFVKERAFDDVGDVFLVF